MAECAIIPRGERRHRFWAHDHQSLFVRLSSMRKRRGASLPAAVQINLELDEAVINHGCTRMTCAFHALRASVVDCASPLALFVRSPLWVEKRQGTAAVQNLAEILQPASTATTTTE